MLQKRLDLLEPGVAGLLVELEEGLGNLGEDGLEAGFAGDDVGQCDHGAEGDRVDHELSPPEEKETSESLIDIGNKGDIQADIGIIK